MKKIISCIFIVALLFCVSALGGCKKENTDTLTIVVPDGAPILAVYNMLGEDVKVGGYDVEVRVLSGASNIAGVVTSGEADVAVMPTNVAAKIYNKGTDVKLYSVNIFGVLYMIGDVRINALTDLYGKIICNIGRGGTPDLTLKCILEKNNVEYVESETAVAGKVALNYVSAGSEAIAMKRAGKCDYAVLGEPVVTQANKNLGTQVVMDLTEEWSVCVGENSYMQAGVVLSKKVYENEDLVSALGEKLRQNHDFLALDCENIKSTLLTAGSGIRVDFTSETVSRLNVGYESALSSKSRLEAYFTAIAEFDKSFVGGKLPDSAFYYGNEE